MDQGDDSTTLTTPTPRPDENTHASDYDLEFEYDSDLEVEINTNLFHLARENFHKRQYGEAERFLQKLMTKVSNISNSTSTVDVADINSKQLQLACCQLFQSRWGPCSSILLMLARDSPMDVMGLPTLLHAVAVGLLSMGSCTEAQRFCKLALQRKRKVWGKGSTEYAHALALLVRIAVTSGDTVEALALRRAMPSEYGQRDIVMDDKVTGLGFLSYSKEIAEIVDVLWGQPPAEQILPPPGSSTMNLEDQNPGHDIEEIKSENTNQDLFGVGNISLINNPSSHPRIKLLNPYTTKIQPIRNRTPTRIPPLSTPLTSLHTYYCADYRNLYSQRTSNLPSPSLPPRESETDTFKECASVLYLYVQSLGSSAKPFLSPGVAILGYDGKLTCTRDWSVRGVETKVSSGGSSYSVDLSRKYDMLYMIVYARFLEHCDRARKDGKSLEVTAKDHGHITAIVEEVTDDSVENSTDTYKEVYYESTFNADSKLNTSTTKPSHHCRVYIYAAVTDRLTI